MRLRTRLWLWLSGGWNAIRHRGDPAESTSARAWREATSSEAWERRMHRIDRFLGDGHCRRVHEQQIKREDARRKG